MCPILLNFCVLKGLEVGGGEEEGEDVYISSKYYFILTLKIVYLFKILYSLGMFKKGELSYNYDISYNYDLHSYNTR